MKKALLRTMAALAAVLCMVVPAAVAAPAQAASSAAFLKGTWVGSSQGYWEGRHTEGMQKIVISTTKGHAAKGTWQYRSSSSSQWGKPAAVSFVVRSCSDGTLEVYGSDESGSYEGVYTPWTGVLEMAYMAPGEASGTLFFKLTKK